uniref:Uncharacterized protein n=1 Tax=Cacopsylla melanoneura TaxID=428564 RepID=A0A8D8M423_9HEMI
MAFFDLCSIFQPLFHVFSSVFISHILSLSLFISFNLGFALTTTFHSTSLCVIISLLPICLYFLSPSLLFLNFLPAFLWFPVCFKHDVCPMLDCVVCLFLRTPMMFVPCSTVLFVPTYP